MKETCKFKIIHIKTLISSLSSVKDLFKSKESNHFESLSWSSYTILFAMKVSSQKSNLSARKDTLWKEFEKGYNNSGKGGDQEE